MGGKKLNVWALAVAIVKGIGPLIRAMAKDSPGGKRISPSEMDEILGTLLLVGQEYLEQHASENE
tara:strand:- start:242 stop:436 length:195 start_codon:yes stop_codon:yes gene_type:complete